MHVNSLLHVRDHAKVRGTADHLLAYIALHVNRHTGEAFELSVDRLAHRLDVTPQWVSAAHPPGRRRRAARPAEPRPASQRLPHPLRALSHLPGRPTRNWKGRRRRPRSRVLPIPPQKENVSKDERENHVNVGINHTQPETRRYPHPPPGRPCRGAGKPLPRREESGHLSPHRRRPRGGPDLPPHELGLGGPRPHRRVPRGLFRGHRQKCGAGAQD